jgi:serine/threonine protein kinase
MTEAAFVGQTIARYRVVEKLGSGGMGEVFRAIDNVLQRPVALKILPPEVIHDEMRLRRFILEAQSASALNHPNIVTIHDVGAAVVENRDGTSDTVHYIAMELIEGETLAKRIRDGAPLRILLELMHGVADALAKAHSAGILHRDLKPDNIMVTSEDRAKVVDFGLAKLIHGEFNIETDSPTVERTREGIMLGTIGYMSPEQIAGKAIDARSDIFSFGCVLYEATCRKRPFVGQDAIETLHNIQRSAHLQASAVDPALPPAIDRITNRCLAKDPEDRYQSMKEVEVELRLLLRDLQSSEATVTAAAPRPKHGRRNSTTLALVALALFVAAGAATIGYFGRRVPRDTPQVHRVHRLTDFPGVKEFPSISPDGRSVAFSASVKGHRQIFVRLLAGGMPLQITSDAVDHQLPRWSPDGNSLLYFSAGAANEVEGTIWSIPALGGSPRRIIDSIGAADISRDGRLACFRLMNGQVQLVTSSFDGTDVQVIARSGPGYHRYPRWSPDGQWIAFQRGDGVRYDIFVIPRTGGEPRQITHDRNMIRGLAWLPDGKGIVYSSSRGNTLPYLPVLALWQVPLQGGAPRQITAADGWYEQPDVHASTGFVSATRVRMRFDIWSFPFDADAAENVRRAAQLTRQTGRVLTPSASVDGDHIAFLSDSGGHGNLWVMSNRRGDVRQITFEDDPAITVGVPVWSPDGRSIAFVSSKGRTGFEFGVWLVDADGRNLRNVAKRGLGIAWSEDSQWLYYAETAAGVLDKVHVAGGTAVRVRNEPTRNVIGLHGTTLYYTVERVLLDGRPELEIRAATPESGPSRALARIPASRVPSWQIVNPALSPDGEWLAMPLTDGFTTNIWALSARNGTWRQVTDFGDRATFIARRVSWSSDGRAILASVGEGDADIVLFEGLIHP